MNRPRERALLEPHGRGGLQTNVASTSLGPPLPDGIKHLLDAWRDCLSPATRRAYAADLAHFAAWAGAPSSAAALEALLRSTKLQAETSVLAYLAYLRGEDGSRRPLSPATIGRRRAALRSLVRMAEGMGMITWTLTAPLPRSQRARGYRDTRGPGLAAVRAMREAAAAQGGVKGLRDLALLSVLYTLGLRRAEVCALDVNSFDAAGHRLAIVGKGHTDAEWLTVPLVTAEELSACLEAREPPAKGALFLSLDRARKGTGRLTPSGLYVVVRFLARKAEVPQRVSPHRLRHSAITDALDGLKGDVRRGRLFSRHAKIDTLLTYDDRRTDSAGEVAAMLAAALGRPRRADHSVDRAAHAARRAAGAAG